MTYEVAANAALFDLGGVLIEWDPAVVYRKAFADQLDRVDRFLAGPMTEIGLASCQTPGPIENLVPAFSAKYPEFASFFAFFASDWDQFVQGPMPQSIVLLERLAARGVPLYGLTNWPEATFPPAGSSFDFLKRFNGIVVSGAEGMRKPDAEIFALTCARFGLAPELTVYIDDHRGNVASAAEFGLRSHHFTTALELERFFVEHGLLG
jgi:2-haloacid dehalogenase